MIVTTRLNLRRADSLLILLSLSILHVGTCQAQDNFGPGPEFYALPFGLFFGIGAIMCCCFWTIVCTCFCFQYRAQRLNNPQRPQYGTVTQPYSTQGHVISSITPGHPPPTQEAYPGQAYVLSTVVAASIPPAPGPGATSQTVPQASEPVSLPEATLHQGDAPPAYEEAVTMKTVCQD